MTPVSLQTKPKSQRPSSPRQFFQKLYGDLEANNKDIAENKTTPKNRETDLIAPIPILATPLPLLFPHGSESQLAAAAAGLSAFCKYLHVTFFP